MTTCPGSLMFASHTSGVLKVSAAASGPMTAAIDCPSPVAAAIASARAHTSPNAVARSRTPAAHKAESSPSECPATKSGRSPAAAKMSNAPSETATVAGCACAVSCSRASWPRSASDAYASRGKSTSDGSGTSTGRALNACSSICETDDRIGGQSIATSSNMPVYCPPCPEKTAATLPAVCAPAARKCAPCRGRAHAVASFLAASLSRIAVSTSTACAAPCETKPTRASDGGAPPSGGAWSATNCAYTRASARCSGACAPPRYEAEPSLVQRATVALSGSALLSAAARASSEAPVFAASAPAVGALTSTRSGRPCVRYGRVWSGSNSSTTQW
mmetsp:Transcript_19493/g.63724  ORF Transcript_19493/g.63724 Transcript_19493/m.63724 type:complete len:332 (+) Transcript_19493:1260-2255(+)